MAVPSGKVCAKATPLERVTLLTTGGEEGDDGGVPPGTEGARAVGEATGGVSVGPAGAATEGAMAVDACPPTTGVVGMAAGTALAEGPADVAVADSAVVVAGAGKAVSAELFGATAGFSPVAIFQALTASPQPVINKPSAADNVNIILDDMLRPS